MVVNNSIALKEPGSKNQSNFDHQRMESFDEAKERLNIKFDAPQTTERMDLLKVVNTSTKTMSNSFTAEIENFSLQKSAIIDFEIKD